MLGRGSVACSSGSSESSTMRAANIVDTELVEQIADSVLESGRLSKEAICTAWDLSDEQYDQVRRSLAHDARVGRSGSRRGGLAARKRKGALPEDSEGDQPLLTSSWEAATVERLTAIFLHRDLEELLGDLLFTLRQVRKHETNRDRRGTKRELATALVLQHGIDLLADHKLKNAIGAACGVKPPGRWHPGKAAAIQFVRDVDLPSELAGVPVPSRPPHSEWIRGLTRIKPLEDFQKEIQRKLLVRFASPGERCIVTLPTGAGKTRTAIESIQFWLKDRWEPHASSPDGVATALWLAHTEELCEQACACFKQVWSAYPSATPLLLTRFWGGYTRSDDEQREAVYQTRDHPCVLVSTPQRIVNLLRSRDASSMQIVDDLRGSVKLIVIDEAHRAATPSYREILDVLAEGSNFDEHQKETTVIGLTATPFRMEYAVDEPDTGTEDLRRIFGELVEPIDTLGTEPRLELQHRGVLAKPTWETVGTATRIRLKKFGGGRHGGHLTSRQIDQIDRTLAIRTDNSARRLVLFDKLKEICRDREAHALYFGPSVRDAECMAFLLRRDGISAAPISGNTRESTRRQIIDDFRSGDHQVLCNCQVLTTGFDDPSISHVVVGRPTVSRVLYEQIVGRGLRGPKFGGTDHCHIIDCQDEILGLNNELGYEAFRRIWSSS